MKEVIFLKSRIEKEGGAEKYTKQLAVAFHQQGCHVSLITSGKIPKESLCEIISDEWIHPLSFMQVLKFDRFCRKMTSILKPEIVFGLDRNTDQTHLRASNGSHAAYLEHRKKQCSFLKSFSFKINPLHRILLNIEKKSFENPMLQKLFVNSNMVREDILKHYSINPQKISVIHNGVEWKEMETDFISWEEKKQQLINELKLHDSAFHFVFIGHNYRRKGLEILLKALNLLPHEDFHLSVVGKEKNFHAFKALVKTLKLEKKVSFFPAQKEVRKFYQLADALVIPSFYDPFANVTIEALAMGVYTVTSQTNGGKEVIAEGSGKIIEDLYDIESVASTLKHTLSYPKTKTSSLNIRNSVKHLDFSTQLMRYVNETLS